MNSLRSLEDWSPPSNAVLKLQVEENVVRRIPASRIFQECSSSRGCYSRILQLAYAYHPTSVQTDTFATTYIDEDGDVITISSDREVVEAWQQFIPKEGEKPLPFRVRTELKKNIPAAECERKRKVQEKITHPELICLEAPVETLPALVTPSATAPAPAETPKKKDDVTAEEVDTEIMLGRGSDKSNMPASVDSNERTFGSSSNDGSTSFQNPIDEALCSDKLSAQDVPSKGIPRNQHSTQSQPNKKGSYDHSTSTPDNSEVGKQQQSKSSTSSSEGSRMANLKEVKGTIGFGFRKMLGIHGTRRKHFGYDNSSLTQPIQRKKQKRAYGSDTYLDNIIPSFVANSDDNDDDYVPPHLFQIGSRVKSMGSQYKATMQHNKNSMK